MGALGQWFSTTEFWSTAKPQPSTFWASDPPNVHSASQFPQFYLISYSGPQCPSTSHCAPRPPESLQSPQCCPTTHSVPCSAHQLSAEPPATTQYRQPSTVSHVAPQPSQCLPIFKKVPLQGPQAPRNTLSYLQRQIPNTAFRNIIPYRATGVPQSSLTPFTTPFPAMTPSPIQGLPKLKCIYFVFPYFYCVGINFFFFYYRCIESFGLI